MANLNEPAPESPDGSDNEPVSNEVINNEIVRPPRRALTGCVFLLPLALLLGLLGQELRNRMNPDAPVENSTTILPTPGPSEVRSRATPEQSSTPETASGQASSELQQLTIYVPGEDAYLHPKVIKGSALGTPIPTTEAQEGEADWYKTQGNRALQLLFKEANNIFPPDTPSPTISSVNWPDGIVAINFKSGFESANMWQGEKIVQLAVYSIVNTLNSRDLNRDGKPKKVQILIDNKPIEVLGALDVSTPLEPNMELVAQS